MMARRRGQPFRASTGSFRTQGSKIIGPTGELFVAKGVNHWASADDRDTLAAWGFNCIRHNHVWDFPWYSQNGMDNAFDLHTAEKWVVMPEWHEIGTYGEDNFVAIGDFWRRIATKYKNNTYMWFNILNEPGVHPTDAAAWLSFHRAMIQIIRDECGASNIIVVDGCPFGQDLTGGDCVATNTTSSMILAHAADLMTFGGKTYPNIVFSVHIYSAFNCNADTRVPAYLDTITGAGIPLIIGEYGVSAVVDTTPAALATFAAAPPRKIGRLWWHYSGGANPLTTAPAGGGFSAGSGALIDDLVNPTNLTAMGQMVWDDNHS